jgi:hypothetical protein
VARIRVLNHAYLSYNSVLLPLLCVQLYALDSVMLSAEKLKAPRGPSVPRT